MDGSDPDEERPVPFPGAAFWQGLESLLISIGLGSPRTIFKLRNARVRWELKRAATSNIDRGVSYTHKACPGCGKLVPRGTGRCAYCDANVRWAPGPGVARTLGLGIPHGSVAMTLITVNIVLFAVSSFASARSLGVDFMSAVFRPATAALYNMGALEASSVFFGQIWRLWTYQFLHGGAIHILFNMYALFSLGPATEDVYGPSKTATLYWLTGTGAGIASLMSKLVFYPQDGYGRIMAPPTVGASGAIFGLIGVLIGHALRRGGSQGAYLRSFLIRWAVYGLVMGFMMGADNAAHVGGLATGLVLGFLVRDGEPARAPGSILWRLAALSVAALTIYGFAAAAFAPHA